MAFLYTRWHALPLYVRVLVATQFGFSKIGPTHVFNNQIQSDGYDLGDVERALNVEALQAYTGSTTKDVEELWDLMLAKIEGRVPLTEVAAIVSEPTELNAEPLPVTEPKKRGRKKK